MCKSFSLVAIADIMLKQIPSNVMFIETICTDAIVERNIRAVKLSSPDVSLDVIIYCKVADDLHCPV